MPILGKKSPKIKRKERVLENVLSLSPVFRLPLRRNRCQKEAGAGAAATAAVGAPIAAVALAAPKIPVAGPVDAERQGV